MKRFPPAPDRCAVQSDLRGDEMLGTAFPAARLLLVEQPFPWGPQGLRTSRFDQQTALAVEARGREEGVRVQAIRRLGRDAEPHRRRWTAVDTRTGTVRFGLFDADAELLEIPLDGSTGEPDPEPIYLVCTHGRHDPCCASRGRPLVTRLAKERPGRVWQASHLGGCRFAPTVLVLPLGLMYGRFDPEDAEALVTATDAGEVLAGHLRGRIGHPPAAQAALAFAHERLGVARAGDLVLVSATTLSSTRVRVCLATPDGPYDVTVERGRVDASGLTCAAPGPAWFMAHRAVAIEPATAA